MLAHHDRVARVFPDLAQRLLARQQLEQQQPERMHVGARVDARCIARQLLRRHVERRAQQRAGLRQREILVPAFQRARDAEVDELGLRS